MSSKRLLVLGGTRFVGRHIVDRALQRGWDVSLFTRGATEPDLFPEAKRLTGDRMGDASALAGLSFDAVVDTSAYHPAAVTRCAVDAGRYCLVSTISVFADMSESGITEESPVAEPPDPLPPEFVPDLYGPLKLACEREAARIYGSSLLVVRPGLIVGPYDYSDRFTYWTMRAARGGTILAPGRPQRQVQVVDVRDLAAWMLAMLDTNVTGTLNAAGPDYRLDMQSVLQACAEAAGTAPDVEWVDGQWLLAQGVEEWTDLPLWLPEESSGLLSCDVSRAISAGLRFRPLADTARDTLAWRSSDPRPLTAGLTAEREAELLRAWKS